MGEKTAERAPRDRWADWAVAGVLVVALLLGWVVMSLAEGDRSTYTDAESGLTVHYPSDWLLKNTGGLAFRAVDLDSGQFKTKYEIRVQPAAESGTVTSSLAAGLNMALLSRAQEGTAYRQFDTIEGQAVNGRPTMETSYVYVVEGNDIFFQQMPVVVLGLDVALAHDNKTTIFSLLAGQEAFADAERGFRKFVESAEIGG